MRTIGAFILLAVLPACGGSEARPSPDPSEPVLLDAASPAAPGTISPDAAAGLGPSDMASADLTAPDAAGPGTGTPVVPDAGQVDGPPAGGPDASMDRGRSDTAIVDAAPAPSDQGSPSPDAATPPDVPPTPPVIDAREQFFRPEVIHQIALTIDPARWEAYLSRHRSFPMPSGDKWFAGDFVIDGTPLRQVGFHGFGWGSRLDTPNKPNLSIDIDRNVPGQSLRGIERMRLKNNGQDTSALRQTILYQAMRASNLMAPRSTYAELTVNGQPYGFYLVEEAFSDGFVRERTGNADGAAYEPTGCQGFVSPPAGCERLIDYFHRPFNVSAGGVEKLVALCQVMNGPADSFLTSVAALIPLPEWIEQLAIDTALAGNVDGFSASGGNFRLYHDTNMDRLRLVILGPDDTFEPDFLPVPNFRTPEPHDSCRTRNPSYRDIFLEKLTATPQELVMYQTAVRRLRTGALSPEAIQRRIDELWALIGARVAADPTLDAGSDPERSKNEIIDYVGRRWPTLQQAGF